MGFISMLSQQQSEKLLSLAFFQPSREDLIWNFFLSFFKGICSFKIYKHILGYRLQTDGAIYNFKNAFQFFSYFPPFSRKKECHTFSKAVDITVTLIAFQAIDFIYQVAYKLEYFSYFLSLTTYFLGMYFYTNIHPSFFIQPFIAEPFTYE